MRKYCKNDNKGEKIMKKLVVLLLSIIMVLSLVACGANKDIDADQKAQTDMEYVKENGTLVVGITDIVPLDYEDENTGEWTGFDADMAREFAKYLGVDVRFKEIVWSKKQLELDGKTIDCIWNGMTLNEERKEAMNCSAPYCQNKQVVIVKQEVAEQYQTEESIKNLKIAVERGSAGKDVVDSLGITNCVEMEAQSNAIMEVNSGNVDAAIIDYIMACASTGDGTGYPNLTQTISFGSEEYGVGSRKNSDLAEEWNKFWKESYDNGTVMEIAKKYNLQDAVIKPE